MASGTPRNSSRFAEAGFGTCGMLHGGRGDARAFPIGTSGGFGLPGRGLRLRVRIDRNGGHLACNAAATAGGSVLPW